jgi:hypothetical protein
VTSRADYLIGGAVVLAIIVLGIAVMVIVVRRSGSRRPSRRQAEIQRAAAADVAAIQEDEKSFRPDGPGDQHDDL